MIKAGIVGATGYTGIELVGLLKSHPQVKLQTVTSQSFEGQMLADVYPGVTGQVMLSLEEMDIDRLAEQVDVLFIALPHGHASEIAPRVLEKGVRLIDLGADFRFRDASTYEAWYRVKHGSGDICPKAVYGLAELNTEAIRQAVVVGNPGCYPTSILLGLAPLVSRKLVAANSIIVDAKSGVSGAGRGLALGSHFAEANENINPYGVSSHRHLPEIEQELGFLAGEEVRISFTPHLVPMTRGILSTIYLSLKQEMTEEELRSLYQQHYDGNFFVKLLPQGQWPHTKWVYGSNYCHLNVAQDRRTGRVIVFSAIDNLVKGAAGQAIQNLNLMFGWPEETGLDFPSIYP